MFSINDFRSLVLILTLFLLIHIPILFIIYNDIVYAFVVPIISGGVGLLFGLVFESISVIGLTTRIASESDIENGLLPISRLLVGLFYPVGFMLVDILSQSERIGYPWFWSQFVAIYTFWIVGIIIMRYRALRKSIITRERYEEIKSRSIESNAHIDELSDGD
ncbi:MAG: hypothetical protein ACFFEV_03195 [Candidatus Thorarchaeota archaeon]